MALMLLLPPVNINSQCKSFFRSRCLPQLSPYTFNGEVFAETFFDKDTGIVDFVFYANQQYRVGVCFQNTLPNTYFEVVDKDGVVYFSSKNMVKKDNTFHYWDFKTNTTIPLKIKVYTLGDEKGTSSTGLTPSGCVVILTGFKE